MPTPFDSDFDPGDIIEADHVKQFIVPVNNLETGRAFYAGTSSGSASAYTVLLSPTPEATPYNVGMIVNFKAHVDNAAAPTLNVNALGAKPLIKNGGSALAAADIKAGQIVSVLYDGTSFQLLSVAVSGGASVAALTDLTDVTITTPATGQVLRKSAGDWVNSTLQASDLPAHQHSGSDITSSANYNTCIGSQSGQALTTGTSCTFLGYAAGYSTTTSTGSVAIGAAALYTNSTGTTSSVAVGFEAAYASTVNITAVGAYALRGVTTGFGNAALGQNAGRSLTTGVSNTLMGANSNFAGVTASRNVAIGNTAMYWNVAGSENVVIGMTAGVGGGSGLADYNSCVLIGYQAGWILQTAAADNVFIGRNSGSAATTAAGNTALGRDTGLAITTSPYNTLLGYQAGNSISSGSGYNVAIGAGAQVYSATGTQQVNVADTFQKRQVPSLATASTQVFAVSSYQGEMIIADTTNGTSAKYFADGSLADPVKVYGHAEFVTGAPGAGQSSIRYNVAGLQVSNNVGATKSYQIIMIGTA
jgi:hypothetical protein